MDGSANSGFETFGLLAGWQWHAYSVTKVCADPPEGISSVTMNNCVEVSPYGFEISISFLALVDTFKF